MKSKLLPLYGSVIPKISKPETDNALDDDREKREILPLSLCCLSRDVTTKGSVDFGRAKTEEIKCFKVFNCDVAGYLGGFSEFLYKQVLGMDSTMKMEEVKKDFIVLTQKAVHCVEDRLHLIMPIQSAWSWALSVLEDWILHDYCSVLKLLATEASHIVCTSKIPGFGNDIFDSGGQYKYCNRSSAGGWCEDTPFVYSFRTNLYTSDNERRNKKINIINVSSGVDPLKFTGDHTTQYYFHGTNWNNVDNIVKKGIILQPGSNDFSCDARRGFYISDNFRKTEEFSCRKHGKFGPAVIVFKAPLSFFDESRLRHLDLTRADRGTLDVINAHFRANGKSTEFERGRLITENYQVISGPLLLNPIKFMEREDAIRSRDVIQTCILDKTIATQFYEFIDCILYFKKTQSQS